MLTNASSRDGAIRPPYAELLATIEQSVATLPRIRRDAQQWFAERGVTFGIPNDGVAPIFPFDPVPRVLAAGEWRSLSRALSQRAMALDLFVSDCYGSQRAIRNGVVPGRLVYSSTGYLRDIVGIRPPRSTWCHVSGIDVVRVEGTFHVLEDNVRIPSGIAYALESRRAMESLAPDWFELAPVRPIHGYTGRLRRILQRIAPRQWDADIVVLTPGSYNAAYYEHRLLADEMRATLVEGHELIVVEDEVYRRDAEGAAQRVDVIYSRVNSEWLDPLVFRRDSMLGAPGLIEAWRRGNVAIANAPGTGVADDKVIYPYVPAMIRYYLGEEPLIDNVPTYDLTDDRSAGTRCGQHRQHGAQAGGCERWLWDPLRAADGIGRARRVPRASEGESASVARAGGGRAQPGRLPASGRRFRAACRRPASVRAARRTPVDRSRAV